MFSNETPDNEISESAYSDDEFGVNDEYFNFNQFKFPGVDLTDIEDPEKMQDLFPEVYVKPKMLEHGLKGLSKKFGISGIS